MGVSDMSWTDQIDLATVKRLIDELGANPSLVAEAKGDLNGFLDRHMGIQSPTRLSVHELPSGWFICAESEPAETAVGYRVGEVADSEADELSDSELELVSAGSPAYGPVKLTPP
jgi:hypothetical protein